MGILDELVAEARMRVEAAKAEKSFDEMYHDATVKSLNQKATAQLHLGGMSQVRGASSERGPLFWFGQMLGGDQVSFVCEIKKASPTTGPLATTKPLARIVPELEQAGASALCYVTEPSKYEGSDETFAEVYKMTSVPLLRRDVVVDEYQLHEAKLMDAAGATLSCAILDGKTIEHYIQVCDLLGIDAFVEVHNEIEVKTALDAGSRIIAVDARDPQTGEVDLGVVERLSEVVPLDCTFVAMSGVQSVEDVERLVAVGVDAIMIGEALLCTPFMGALLSELCFAAKKKREEGVETSRGKRFAGVANGSTPPPLAGGPGVVLGAPAGFAPMCPPAPGRPQA